MRRLLQLSAFCVAAAVASGCDTPATTIPTEDLQVGGVRFINAVPDAALGAGFDFRFIDRVENNALWQHTFRNAPTTTGGVTAAALTEYKPARVGVRKFRIFPNDSLQSVASTVLVDGTITIEKGHNYSVIMMGLASQTSGVNAMTMKIVDETVPEPAKGKVSIRMYNTTGSTVNGRVWLVGTAEPAAPTTGWSAVPAYTASAYATVDTGAYAFSVRGAADATPLTCNGLSIVGANAVTGAPGPFDAIPGSRAEQSAITAFVFPGSVAGTKSTQFVTTTGSQLLAATATGITRATGSFVTDCLVVGQTITLAGFSAANNGNATITALSATSITIDRVLVVQAAAAGRTLTVTPNPPGQGFVWDKRPPRPVGV